MGLGDSVSLIIGFFNQEEFTNRTMARLNREVVVLDHLDNR